VYIIGGSHQLVCRGKFPLSTYCCTALHIDSKSAHTSLIATDWLITAATPQQIEAYSLGCSHNKKARRFNMRKETRWRKILRVRLDERDEGRKGKDTILDEEYEDRAAWSYHNGWVVLRPLV
jgi:hypothetical protein